MFTKNKNAELVAVGATVGAAVLVCADGLTRRMSHSGLGGTLSITQDPSTGRAGHCNLLRTTQPRDQVLHAWVVYNVFF